MKDFILSNKKSFLIILVVFALGILSIRKIENNIINKVVLEEDEITLFLEENQEKIKFYATIYKIDNDKLYDLLKNNYEKLNLLNYKDSFDLILINYLFDLEATQKNLFDNNIESNKESKDYILNVLKYFTNIYTNVDYSIAAAIAEVESNFTSEYMLSCNNIFGGMSKGKLIKYKTIEYGILKYVNLLNNRYFGKGLNTIESIGKVYNPMITEEGIKIANPKWVKNVTNALENYSSNKANITLESVLSLHSTVKNIE